LTNLGASTSMSDADNLGNDGRGCYPVSHHEAVGGR
jgi:hypothetical protein